MRLIRLETIIGAPVAACFELSLSVDAHAASMSHAREQPIAGKTNGVMTLGDTVTWRARHFGVPFQMTSQITEYVWPSWFVDEQRRGPFHEWWHEHQFSSTWDGRTQMTDVVRFCSPLGPLGFLADRFVLDDYMRALLVTRNSWLKQTLESK